MKRHILDYLFRGKRTRAVAGKDHHVDLTDAELAAVRRHLAANHLKVVGERIVEVDDPWHAWVRPARPDVDLAHVNIALLDRLAAVAQELGAAAIAASAFRSREHQAELYDEYLHHGGPLAAAPGHSNHEIGEAVDAYVRGMAIGATPAGRAALRRHRLVLGASGEPWHVERAEVGSWRGPHPTD